MQPLHDETTSTGTCDEHDTRNGEETFPDDYAHRDGISICFNCTYQYNWWISLWRINLYAYE